MVNNTPTPTPHYHAKKVANIIICLAISLLGITAFIYKARYEGGILTCFREMTVNGTVFTTVASFALAVISIYELMKDRQVHSHFLYYLRLSSVVTEGIVLLVTIIGTLPIFPDKPVFNRYDMINMHVILPLLTITSFIFNDAPIGRLRPHDRLNGLMYVTMYAVIIVTLILLNVIPRDKIPYSILDVRANPWYTLMAFAIIFGIGYMFSWLFSELNRRLSPKI